MISRKENTNLSGSLTVDDDIREIVISGSISYDMAGSVVAAIRRMSIQNRNAGISVVLMSGGGEEGAGWAIHDQLKLAEADTAVQAFGECQSIAALILQGGSTRLMAPNCRFMVHNGRIDVEADTGKILRFAEEAMKLNTKYYLALKERSYCTYDEIKNMCYEETYLDAEACLGYGFIDGILTPSHKCKTKAKRKR
jgi:ATP-dependent Clp protease protease subunit